MRICAAQISPIIGNVKENIKKHLSLIKFAKQNGFDFIFFPELSLTGYEPTLANHLAFKKSDDRLNVFTQISNESNINIGVSAPIRSNDLPYISMLIYQPNQTPKIYHKRLLHEDELPYFSSGELQLVLDINSERLAPAICYESLQESIIQDAINEEASIFVASVAKNQASISNAQARFANLSQEHNLFVIMANCYGQCDTFESVGRSGAWLKSSGQSITLDKNVDGIVGIDSVKKQLLKFVVDNHN